jgi:hypothetical protein
MILSTNCTYYYKTYQNFQGIKKNASVVLFITGFNVHAETSVQDIFTRPEKEEEWHRQYNSLLILISVISLIFTDSASYRPTVKSIHFSFNAYRF